MGPGAQCVPSPGVHSPETARGGCVQGTAQPAPPTSTSLARGSSKDPSLAPGCKHGTSTWLRCQQLIAKQMPPHSPSPNGCTPGVSKKTQSLPEPLWPMQTGVRNETGSPYWHHEVQATFIPLWLPIPPPLPSSTHKKPGRTGQGSASHGVHSGGSKRRCLSWGRPRQQRWGLETWFSHPVPASGGDCQEHH